jgi:hypothetical protein
MMRALWVTIGAAAVGAISFWLIRARGVSTEARDLGPLSDQWIAEHRAGIDDGLYR